MPDPQHSIRSAQEYAEKSANEIERVLRMFPATANQDDRLRLLKKEILQTIPLESLVKCAEILKRVVNNSQCANEMSGVHPRCETPYYCAHCKAYLDAVFHMGNFFTSPEELNMARKEAGLEKV